MGLLACRINPFPETAPQLLSTASTSVHGFRALPYDSRTLFRDGQTVAFKCAALPVEVGAHVVEQREKAWVVAHRVEFGERYFDEQLSVRHSVSAASFRPWNR